MVAAARTSAPRGLCPRGGSPPSTTYWTRPGGPSTSRIADCLWVDVDTLQTRLDTLTDQERAALLDLYRAIERGA
ncbi:MAG: hypothetical protein NVV70_06325 [Cellulomonas sp.]|nr:hypothetical protein [Cellulomonas sp.]MCR6647760.1 hypothetical protein [Cellulomonas sp.]